MTQDTRIVRWTPPLTERSAQPDCHVVNVGLDCFGNAIPELGTDSGKRNTPEIVMRRDVRLGRKPRRRIARNQPLSQRIMPRLFERMTAWLLLPEADDQALVVKKPLKNKLPSVDDGVTIDTHAEGIEQVFRRLHDTFNEREARLENKLRALEQSKLLPSEAGDKRRYWLWPVVAAVAAGMGVMLYIMASMQTSMIDMSGNIQAMNQHMSQMAVDTRGMAQNVRGMNESMYYMNNNVVYMSDNVAQMNRQVGNMAHSVAPMGDAASTFSPVTKFFKSFMPF